MLPRRLLLTLILFSALPAMQACSEAGAAQAALLRTAQTLTTPILATKAINVACDANIHLVTTPACATTSAVPMLGYTDATIHIRYTKSAATAVTLWMDELVDVDTDGTADDVPWAIVQATNATDSPTIRIGDAAMTWPATGVSLASSAWSLTFKNINSDFVRWRFVGTGAGAGDTVQVRLARRGQ